MHVYLVHPGDTREKIAERFRVSQEALARCNALPPEPFLLPGQSLAIPSELECAGTDGYCTYQVQAGDTLRRLSAQFGIPATWIAFCNDLNEPVLRAGDFLLLPYTKSFTQEAWRGQLAVPSLQLLRMEAPPDVEDPEASCTYRGGGQLQVDAAGRLHFPERMPEKIVEPMTDSVPSAEKSLLLCTLAGSDHILPDVAKAILQSGHAQHLILDSMAAQLRTQGGDGVIFQWQGLRPELYDAYLSFVHEAGRRLRPMGLVVSLYLRSDSPLLKKTQRLSALAAQLDHFFYDPIPASESVLAASLQRQAPAPLVGVSDTAQAIRVAEAVLPHDQLWLVLHPVGLLSRLEQVVATLSPQQALQIAYSHGAPLIREPNSELVFARCPQGVTYTSVWMEDLWSLVRKVELLEERRWQGLALWEAGLSFPPAWHYLNERLNR